MTELEDQLRAELRAAATTVRVPSKPPSGLVARARRRRQRRGAGVTVAITAVLAIVVGAGVVAVNSSREVTNGPAVRAGNPKFPVPPKISVDVTALPNSPLGQRVGASGVWTGSEFIVWGGASGNKVASSGFGDGAAFNPDTNQWRKLADSPLSPRAGHVAVWTGTEMIVWGGGYRIDGFGIGDVPADGGAYNPAADSWRRIADAPSEAFGAKAVLTGHYVVVGAGTTRAGGNPTVILAYDIAADSWLSIPLDLHGMSGVYDIAASGSGVAVAVLDRNQSPKLRFLHVDIPSGHVEMAPDLKVTGQAVWLGVASGGDQVIAAGLGDGPTQVRLWKPGTSRWADTAEVPKDRLQPRAGIYSDEASAMQWIYGWLVSVGSTGVYIAAPATGETAIPDNLQATFSRLCGGHAAIAFSAASVFVWGGQDCAGNSPNAGGQLNTGARITLRPRP